MSSTTLAEQREARLSRSQASSSEAAGIGVTVLTGGFDPHYACSFTKTLAEHGLIVDMIGGALVDGPEMRTTPGLTFHDLYWDPRKRTGALGKVRRVAAFYARLLRYAFGAKTRIFHILWNNRIELLDRTVLMLFYKLLGKKVTFTAHNVNAGKRDANDTLLNRLTLSCQYRLADHIFVHTARMKTEMMREFRVPAEKITVIPFGVNDTIPKSDAVRAEARRHLGLKDNDKAILFFGAIRPYKGVEYLVEAFNRIASSNPDYRLILAGEPKKGCETYYEQLQEAIRSGGHENRVIQRTGYIPDAEAALYFQAADVSVLPYTHVFLSGVLYLGYGFGLPAVATDVGSFSEDVVEGETGFLCKECDAADLARALETYFNSYLFKTLDDRRQEIQDQLHDRHSWDLVVEITRKAYVGLLKA
jgi:glycosyltransferase involved in cell wall biosynthesis